MQHYYVLLQYAITSFRELLRITSITTITTHYFPGQLADDALLWKSSLVFWTVSQIFWNHWYSLYLQTSICEKQRDLSFFLDWYLHTLTVSCDIESSNVCKENQNVPWSCSQVTPCTAVHRMICKGLVNVPLCGNGQINGFALATEIPISFVIWFSWKCQSWMVLLVLLSDENVSSLLVLMSFPCSDSMQIDSLTFQQGFWSTDSLD